MKLESHLTFRPGMLLIIPLADVVLGLLIFFLLVSSLVMQSGMRIELPPSGFALQGMVEGHVLLVSAGSSPKYILDEREVGIENLAEALDEMAKVDGELKGRVGSLVIKADQATPHGVVMEVSDMALARGFRVGLAGAPPVDGPGVRSGRAAAPRPGGPNAGAHDGGRVDRKGGAR